MGISENAAYIKGLFDGYEIDKTTKEGKIISEMLTLLADMADKINALEADNKELHEYVEELDHDLGEGEDFRVVSFFSWEESEDGGRYDGAFATSFEVADVKRALVVAAWGRRRWNIETGFRVEKHGGFGLEHTFCNDDTAGRNYHVLMQIAYALWQVFDTGVLSRLSEGCRKPTQEMWAKLLFLALLVIGLASVPRVEAGKFRMRRFHIVA